jgi:hypothetical protein
VPVLTCIKAVNPTSAKLWTPPVILPIASFTLDAPRACAYARRLTGSVRDVDQGELR